MNCLGQILTPLLLGFGICMRRNGDSDTYISREINTTAFHLADKGNGLRESVNLKGNHWLRARPVYSLLFVDAQRSGQPEPKR